MPLASCGRTSLAEYKDRINAFQEPIIVTAMDVYTDFGSHGFTVKDATGTSVSFCVHSVTARDTTGGVDMLFGVGVLYVGARDWQWGDAIPVEPNSDLEASLMSLMHKWVDNRFPDWGSGNIPTIQPRLAGTVDDSTVARGFLEAIELVEARKRLLQKRGH